MRWLLLLAMLLAPGCAGAVHCPSGEAIRRAPPAGVWLTPHGRADAGFTAAQVCAHAAELDAQDTPPR